MTNSLEQVKDQAGKLSEIITEMATVITIQNDLDLSVAADLQLQAKGEMETIKAGFKTHKDNAYKTHKDLCRDESEALAPFLEIGSILKPKILEYRIAESGRLAKERVAREDKQREFEARAKKVNEESRTKHAKLLMEAGAFDSAEAVLAAPIVEPMAVFVPEPEKVKVAGAGTKTVWKGRVLDFSKVPDRFKVIDQKAVDAYASALKWNAKEPGLEFYSEIKLTGK